ncbi:MAG: ankyrin repeat domain-containing protein [Coxiellaceae bacterium]|nr:ankyrin repeat domain-containing protein [Coxiellaceae bacterium]
MRSSSRIAASTLLVIFEAREAWRYFVPSSEQAINFDKTLTYGQEVFHTKRSGTDQEIFIDTVSLYNQLDLFQQLPMLADTPLDADILFNLAQMASTAEDVLSTVSIDEEDFDSQFRFQYIENALKHYTLRITEAQSSAPDVRIRQELRAIAKLCIRLSKIDSFNPNIAYLLCIQNNFPAPLVDNWSSLLSESVDIDRVVDGLNNGMKRTNALQGGQPIQDYFTHSPEVMEEYSAYCQTVSESLEGEFHICSQTSAAVKYINAARLNDAEAPLHLDTQIDNAIMVLGRDKYGPAISAIKLPALLVAAQYGHIEFIETALTIGQTDLTNAHFDDGETLLHTAAEHGQLDTVSYLLHRSEISKNPIAESADPYALYNGKTYFNYALRSDVQYAKTMMDAHLENPSLPLGEVAAIVNSDTKTNIFEQVMLPALREGNINAVAFCIDHGFIFNVKNYQLIIDLLAQRSNESGIDLTTRLQIFNLLPDYYENPLEQDKLTTAKYAYFIQQVDADDLLVFPHLSMTPTPTDTESFRRCSQIVHYGILELARRADIARLRAFIMSAFSTATTSQTMPNEYVATILKGAICATDESILHTLVSDNNIAALRLYFDIALNSDAVSPEQAIEILQAPKLFGTPPKDEYLFNMLLISNNADALYTYALAILNSNLTFTQKLTLLCTNDPHIGNVIVYLTQHHDGDKLAALTRAIYEANLTEDQREQMLHQQGVKQYGGIVRSLFNNKLMSNYIELLHGSREDATKKTTQAMQAQLTHETSQQALVSAQSFVEQATTKLNEAKDDLEQAQAVDITAAIASAQHATHQAEALWSNEDDKEAANTLAQAMWDAVDEANAAKPEAEKHYHITEIELASAQLQLKETEQQARLDQENLQIAQTNVAEAIEDIEHVDQLTNTATLLSAQQLAEFVSQTLACDTLNTDQKYRLIWPKGSSKKDGLHELFKPEANKPDLVRAYLQALLKSSLDETVKTKIVRKVTKHMTLPIEGGRFSTDNLALDLALLGYQYKDQYKSGIFCSRTKPEAQIASTLAYIYHQPIFNNHAQPATIINIISAEVRELYRGAKFDRSGKCNSPLLQALAAIADMHGIDLTPLNEIDVERTTISDPIPVPQSPRKSQRYIITTGAGSSSTEAGFFSNTERGGTSYASSITAGHSAPGDPFFQSSLPKSVFVHDPDAPTDQEPCLIAAGH